MTAFVSQRPNTDPEPWAFPDNPRRRAATRLTFDDGTSPYFWLPRPEYTQTRDPLPWLIIDKMFGKERHRQSDAVLVGRDAELFEARWAPRHDEFDPPVNRVLAAFRADERTPWGVAFDARHWLGLMWHGFTDRYSEATQDEISHASRVLSKLAGVYS